MTRLIIKRYFPSCRGKQDTSSPGSHTKIQIFSTKVRPEKICNQLEEQIWKNYLQSYSLSPELTQPRTRSFQKVLTRLGSNNREEKNKRMTISLQFSWKKDKDHMAFYHRLSGNSRRPEQLVRKSRKHVSSHKSTCVLFL